MALGVSWNLTADVSIWFRAKNLDLDPPSWAELKEHLAC